MRLWGQFQACFFFFLQKGLEPKKNTKTLNNKGNIFYARKIFEEGESCLFCVLLLFLRSKPFCKKNVNRLEIVPIASSYYTTTLIVLYYYSEHISFLTHGNTKQRVNMPMPI